MSTGVEEKGICWESHPGFPGIVCADIKAMSDDELLSYQGEKRYSGAAGGILLST